MGATVLAYPTARKRGYPQRYVPTQDLPPNVERLVQPATEPYPNLKKSPELALLMAILSSMEGPIRWRIANEIARFQEHQGPGGYADDLARLLLSLPVYNPDQRP